MLHNSRRGAHLRGGKQCESTTEGGLVIDSLQNEISILSRKLDSKAEALAIVTKELDQCRLDRDQFRAMLEQLKGAHNNKTPNSWSLVTNDVGLRHQLATSRQQCAQLEQMVSDLTQKMEEICGDMMVLRRDAARERCASARGGDAQPELRDGEMLSKMERLQNQCDQLRRDLQQTIDEKEELVTQRDAYKGKAHRLNHQLRVALRAPPGSGLDVDALVTENRLLQERLESSQDEVDRLTQTCAKYKALLEVRKKKGILRLGSSNSSGMVVTKRQVEEMLRTAGGAELSDTPATLADLRSLCAALLEQLRDKCTALTHQKKANRLLAERCSELRQLADRHGLPVQPSAGLMEGYSATHMDRESEQLLDTPDDGSGDGAAGPRPPAGDGSPSSPDETDLRRQRLSDSDGVSDHSVRVLSHHRWPESDGVCNSPVRPVSHHQRSGSDGACNSPVRADVSHHQRSGSDGAFSSTAGAASYQRPSDGSDGVSYSPVRSVSRQPRPDSDGAVNSCAGAGGRQPLPEPAGVDASWSPSPSRPAPEPPEEEIVSIQQLGRYSRARRPAAAAQPRRSPDGPRPHDVLVVSSPKRTVAPARPEPAPLPDELDSLYRRALDELRASEQTT